MRPTVHQLLVQLEPAPIRTASATWGPNTRAAVREAVELRWVERSPDRLRLTSQGRRALEGERRWAHLQQRIVSDEKARGFRSSAWSRLCVPERQRLAETATAEWAA